ncbi:MAG: iron ABC transporter permease [Thermoplasmata archaeon]|nr:iron ABC transporter permease [Thermoplasmata archaeon]
MDSDFRPEYLRLRRRNMLFIAVCLLLVVAAVLITLGMGVYNISIPDAISAWWNHLTGGYVNPRDDAYVWDGRFPRAIMAAFAGAGLAIGGAVMQSVLKNPLTDPYTMGVSSGAFFGAVLWIICGFSLFPFLSGDLASIANAFVFSLIPVGIILILSRYKRITPTAMVLIGVAIMYVFSSFTQYFMVTADSSSLAEAYSWRVGTLADASWDNVPYVVVSVTVLSAVLIVLSRRINVLSMNDNYAQTLGENVQKSRVLLLVIVSLMTASIVSFTGTIGFVGLVCPHVVRMFTGSNSKYLIPASAVFGALFLVAIDSIAKVTGVNGLPVGVVSALIGGPVFAYLLIKSRRSVWM